MRCSCSWEDSIHQWSYQGSVVQMETCSHVLPSCRVKVLTFYWKGAGFLLLLSKFFSGVLTLCRVFFYETEILISLCLLFWTYKKKYAGRKILTIYFLVMLSFYSSSVKPHIQSFSYSQSFALFFPKHQTTQWSLSYLMSLISYVT